MEKRENVLEYRKRLDSTLRSPNLTNKDSVRALVRRQLLRSSNGEFEGDLDGVAGKHTLELCDFLEMLRSVPGSETDALKTQSTSLKDWKLKKDNDQLRVMYREGPEGTPIHTLLAEGYVNGPIDVCVCVSWEAALYPKWWPQISFPPFKVTLSTSLKKVRTGEEISLVRVGLPWPLSMREVILRYFEIEYYEDGLIIVLLNSVDKESIDGSLDGFTSDGIPDPRDAVRMDFIGGFALQQVTSERSYFRTIANLDMKIEFVPPALINFVARQLIGNGFKLYEKAVAEAAKGDQDFDKVLENGPMYIQIRKGLMPHAVAVDIADHLHGEHSSGINDEEMASIEKSPGINKLHDPEVKEDDVHEAEFSLTSLSTAGSCLRENELVSPEVELALEMLDAAISLVRDHGHASPSPIDVNNALAKLVTFDTRTHPSEPKEVEVHASESDADSMDNKMRHLVEPVTPMPPKVGGTRQAERSPCGDEVADVDRLDNKRSSNKPDKVIDARNVKANGIHKSRYSPFRRKIPGNKRQICCLNFV